MANTFTTNLNMTKPEISADIGLWGQHLNENLDILDPIFKADGTGSSVGLRVGVGKVLKVDGALAGSGTLAIGVGAADTQAKMTVSGTIKAQNTTLAYDSTPLDSYGGAIQADSSGIVHIDAYNPAGASQLALGVNTGSGAIQEALRVDSTGNVIIGGTATTGGKFEVQKAQNAVTGVKVYNNNTGASAQARFDIATGSANSYVAAYVTDNGGVSSGGVYAAANISSFNYDAVQHVFRNLAGTERMRINTAGELVTSGSFKIIGGGLFYQEYAGEIYQTIKNTAAGADNKIWKWGVQTGGAFVGFTTNDADSASYAWLNAVRSGNNVTDLVFTASTFIKLNTPTISLPYATVGVELGAVGTANTPLIDFHSSSAATDFDVRIQSSGGGVSSGQGTLTVTAATLAFNASVIVSAGEGAVSAKNTAKAWANFTGANPHVLNSSYNVSSVTWTSTGAGTVNVTTALAANAAPQFSFQQSSGWALGGITAIATGSVSYNTALYIGGALSPSNATIVSFAVFGA